MGRLKDAFDALRGRSRQDSVDFSPELLRFLEDYGHRSKAGSSVSVDTALGVSAVLACTRALAEGVAQIPFKLMLEDEKGQKAPAVKHPAYRVISRRPNQWMDSFTFRETMMYHAVLTGNAFAYKNYIGTGKTKKLVELIPIQPGAVTIRRQNDFTLLYDVRDGAGTFATYDRSQIFHLAGPSWNSYGGLEVIRLAREAIGLSIATEENHAKLHKNGSQVGGILSTDAKLDDANIERIKTMWSEAHEGGLNKFKTALLDRGMKYSPMAMSGVDTQHIQTREHQIQEVCRALNVFPMIIGFADKTATFASAESFFTAHVVLSLSPWVQRWQDACDTQLLTSDEVDNGYFFKLFTAGLLRGDWRARAEFYKTMVLTGIFTRNECRSLEDMNDLEGLDEPLVPMNMTAAGQSAPDQSAGATQPANSSFPNVSIAPKGMVDAMRSAMVGHNGGPPLDGQERTDKGRVLSSANEKLIRDAAGLIGQADGKLTDVLDKLAKEPETQDQ